MKVRESGMPPEPDWQEFFDAHDILRKLGLHAEINHVVDCGCGYGLFSIAAAQLINGKVTALDIDQHMLDITVQHAQLKSLTNITGKKCNFMADGTGLADACSDFVMIFNLLHMENPQSLLAEANRILKDDGILAIIHWNHDPETPRGPPMSIRPKPEHIIEWLKTSGFKAGANDLIDLPPWHYGLSVSKND